MVAWMACLVENAPGAEIDQQNWPPAAVLNAGSEGEVQEFTPTQDSLDSVQLWIPGGIINPVAYVGGATAVNIRQGGFNGPVIAASRPTYTPPFYEGPVGYGFAQPVPLVPGQLYAIEAVRGTGTGLFAFGTPGNYASGRFYTYGSEYPDGDLVFREGIGLDLVPEPSPALLLTGGLVISIAVGTMRLGRRAIVRSWSGGHEKPTVTT